MLSVRFNYFFIDNLPFNIYNKVFKIITPVLFILGIFLISIFANSFLTTTHVSQPSTNKPIQISSPTIPVTTTEPPIDSRSNLIKEVDSNNNLIADGLDSKIATLQPNDPVNVILILKDIQPIPQQLIDQFKSLNGKITFQWDSLGMFAGKMSVRSIEKFASSNLVNGKLGLIEEDRQMMKYSESDQLTNVQPYVWNNYNLLGDSNSSIAVFDTGADASHPMLASYNQNPDFTNNSIKLIGWKDATTDGYTTPVDYDGHGSHVASIAAGNPYNDTNSQGYINTTYSFHANYTQSLSGTYFAWTFINVSSPGYITMNYYWQVVGGPNSTKGVGLYLFNPSGSLVATSTTNTRIDDYSGMYSISYYVGSNFGDYDLQLRFNYADANSDLNMVAYGSYPYAGYPSSATNAKFSGVAPDSKIVAIRVFDNGGNGLASYLVNGINWAIQNKYKYHISIASMSIGFGCSPSGCKSSDQEVSVESAVNNLVAAGIVTFVAAGNDGYANGDQIGTPGNLDSVITVGATDMYHKLTPYSSIGPGLNSLSTKPDLTAPGGYNTDPYTPSGYQFQQAILSADTNMNDADGAENGFIPDFQKNDLTSLQGTSMATPYVAGIGSLLVQAMGGYKNWSYSTTTVQKIKQIMLMSTWATNGTDRAAKDIREGWGEIQADAAIDVVSKPYYQIGGNPASSYISNERFSHKIWGRGVNLTAGNQYNFALNMNSSLDADLYLYSSDYNSYGNPILLKVAKTNGLGAPEYLSFTPASSGIYYIFVKTWTGKGYFHLNSNSIDLNKLPSTSLTIMSPLNGATISSSTVVQVSASNSAGIQYVQARFSGSYVWINLTYNSVKKLYEFTLDPTQFPNDIYASMDIRVKDNNNGITYKTVYYSISTGYTDPDSILLTLQGVVQNQINYIKTNTFTLSFTNSTTPDNVEIYINNQFYTTITNSSIQIDLQDGTYDIRAVAIIGSTERSIGLFYLNINTKPTPPTISGQTTYYYAIGSSDALSWLVSDPNPTNYTIYKDGVAVANGTWFDQVPITISLTNLPKGTYNYTVVVDNFYNFSASSTVTVISYHRTVIKGPSDITFKVGTTGQSVSWNVTDDALANYTIYQDNVSIKSGQLIGTSATITYNLDGLSIGTYKFTLAVYDKDNVLVTSTVNVDVLSATQTTSTTSTSSSLSSNNSTSKSSNQIIGFEAIAVISLFAIIILTRKYKKN